MRDGRLHRFVGGLSLGYVQAVAVALVGLWLTPFYLHTIGQHEFGLWLVVAQMLGYLALTDFGIVAILPREIAHATGSAGQREAPSVSDVVTESVRIIACQMPAVAIAGLIAWVVLGRQWPELREPLGVVTVSFVLSFPFRVFPAVLQGLQDLPYLGRVQLAGWALGTAVTVVLVQAGRGLFALVAGWLATQLLTASFTLVRLVRRFPDALPRRPLIAWGPVRTRIVRGLWVSINQVAQVLLNGTDVMLVGWLLGPTAVVAFSCTGRLISVLANQPQLFMQMAIPVLSELRASASRERLYEVSSALSQTMLLGSGVIVCVVMGVNQGFVTWWVGPQQFAGRMVTGLMLLSMMLRHLNLAVSYTLYSLGYERRLALTAIGDGLLTVSVALLAIPALGVTGALLASILGVSLISLPANLTALASDEGVSVLTALRHLRSWSLRCGVVISIVAMTSNVWTPYGLALVVVAGGIAGLYALAMWPIVSAPPIGPRLARVFAAMPAWLLVSIKAIKPAPYGT